LVNNPIPLTFQICLGRGVGVDTKYLLGLYHGKVRNRNILRGGADSGSNERRELPSI